MDMIDESEVLSPADDENHIDKSRDFKVSFYRLPTAGQQEVGFFFFFFLGPSCRNSISIAEG